MTTKQSIASSVSEAVVLYFAPVIAVADLFAKIAKARVAEQARGEREVVAPKIEVTVQRDRTRAAA
jgi:hypothetical protein